MNRIVTKFFKVCPKTGKIRGYKSLTGFSRIFLPLIGFIALAWILFRVLSKPSRINYPCVQTAMPFASGFIGEIILLSLSALAFMRSKRNLLTSPAFLAVAFAIIGVGTLVVGGGISNYTDVDYPTITLESNQPVGEAKGIFPGRVVWVHDPDATNEDCSPNTPGDGWFLPKNNDQDVIDNMLSEGIRLLTGTTSDSTAWDSVFIFHNRNRGKGNVSYNEDEKIFIKTNIVSGWSGNFNRFDLSKTENGSYGISETSPQIVMAVLRHLVNVVGVPQDKIYIGDPLRHIYKHSYDYWHAEFPDVHYMDHDGYTNLGREVLTKSNTAKIKYSDRGSVLRENVWDPGRPGEDPVYEDFLYTIFEEMEYMINLPMLKGHKRAGITSFAKNHFGSHTREDASHLHNGLIAPTENLDFVSRAGYGLYRVQVDIMGHEILGQKNLVYIMDALWSADQEISYPKKFQIAPFNDDFMSSLFLSLDPVAIESVGYDFLRSEFTTERSVGDNAGTYVQMEGTDDYLHQAASSENWPDGIVYDPENDSTPIASLGVHEHWDNPEDKQYSRNLGTDDGIELLKAEYIVSVDDIASEIPEQFQLNQNYPNPFNPVTNISFILPEAANVNLSVYDITGGLVDKIIENEFKPAGNYNVKFNAGKLSSGIYIVKMNAGNFNKSIKMVLMK